MEHFTENLGKVEEEGEKIGNEEEGSIKNFSDMISTLGSLYKILSQNTLIKFVIIAFFEIKYKWKYLLPVYYLKGFKQNICETVNFI